MFNELLISGPNRRRSTRTRWTVLISLVAELTAVAVLLLLPLIQTQALPFHWMETPIVPPAAPPAPKVHVVTDVTVVRSRSGFQLPNKIPAHARIIHESVAPESVAAPNIDGVVPGSTSAPSSGL